MKEYRVITSLGTGGLEEQASELLADGWVPQGGVSLNLMWEESDENETEKRWYFAQAFCR